VGWSEVSGQESKFGVKRQGRRVGWSEVSGQESGLE
jgi:hypothetical protein